MSIKKERVALSILLLLMLTISCGTDPQDKMIGTWKTLDKDGQSITITLLVDHSASLSEGGIVVINDSLYESVQWIFKSDKDPMQLDITSTSNGKERDSKMIVRFLSEDKIEIRYPDESGNRPKEFEKYHELQQIFMRH